MPTYKDYLLLLPEPYAAEALEELELSHPPRDPDEPTKLPNLAKVLAEAFIWRKTARGFAYWQEIADHYGHLTIA